MLSIAANRTELRKPGIFAAVAIAVITVLAGKMGLAEQKPDASKEFPGQIEALVNHDVSNLVDGMITEVHFKPGQVIQAGEILFTIDASDFELAVENKRLKAVESEAALKNARQEFDRMSKLQNRGLTTEVEMFKSEIALAIGKAKVNQAKADLKAMEVKLARTVIRAPIEGIISQSRVNPGAYVEQGDKPLARIVQMDPVLLSYKIPYVERMRQLEIDDLRAPQELLNQVTLQIKISDDWMHSEQTKAQNISAGVDPATGMMTVYAELANPEYALRPGMNVVVIPQHFGGE